VELLAAPVLQGERYGGRPVYFSDVIVRPDTPFKSFADLRGHSWSFNDLDSHSGYNVTRYHLVKMGETRGFFGNVVAAGFHQESIRLVATGKVDASAIDSQVLAVALRDDPELARQIHVIDTLGPSTIQPVVAASKLPSSLKSDIRAALLNIADDPRARERLSLGFVERFAPVEDSAYDDIRRMLAAAEEAGFMTLR
jgi:phosphonate transport system substrate-binding protein